MDLNHTTMAVYQKTRSKKLVEPLPDLNLSINYDKVINNLITNLANSVREQMTKSESPHSSLYNFRESSIFHNRQFRSEN